MFKPNKLLKVMSWIMIISGILGIISTGILIATASSMQSMVDAGVMEQSVVDMATNPWIILSSLIGCVSGIVAGFFAKGGRKYKAAVVACMIYLALSVMSTFTTIINGTFTSISLIDYVIPILFVWGLYQSKG